MSFTKMVGGNKRKDGLGRNENDYYPTPPCATYALIEAESLHLDKHLSVPGSFVLEPAAGRGWMAGEIARHYPVMAHDVEEYSDPVFPLGAVVDYLKCVDLGAKAIITNPPYAKDMAQKFVEKALTEAPYVAALCRLTWAESKKRYEMFKKHPPSRILFFSTRFSCDESRFDGVKVEGGMVAYAWWVWDKNRPSTTVDWIAPGIYERWRRSTRA